jgi:DNA-binding CsgD family transcriptional regulator
MVELPGPLRVSSDFPLVGRAAALERLRTLMLRTGELGAVALLAGEAGSGKSRLVRELARELGEDGAVILYGASDPVVRTGFGPYREALEQALRVVEPDALRRGPLLAALFPDLPEHADPRFGAPDPDTERHRLHSAVVELLGRVSERAPTLLVIEDMQWADDGSLFLLRRLVHTLPADGPLLLLATYRDTEADVGEALRETLADLHRSDGVVRLQLHGLSRADVTELVRRSGGDLPDSEVAGIARELHDLTRGNPFLVCELWRMGLERRTAQRSRRPSRPLAAAGAPRTVRDVVGQRLSRLSPHAADLVEIGAAAGPQFELDVVRRAAGLEVPALLGALGDAIRNGIIEGVPDRRLGYRFTHELVRLALYDRLSPARRAEIHLRLGDALETSGEPLSGRRIADLAHHFAAAAPLDDAGRGSEYNLLAGRAAAGMLAFDEAAARLRTALELGLRDQRGRAEALLELGDAAHRGGKALEARAAYEAAAQAARELPDGELLARAAIGLEDASWRPGITNAGAVELLEEAVATLGEAGSALHVRVLAGLARALDMQGEHDRAATARATAIDMARRLDDKVGVATVLARAYWARGACAMDEIVEMLTEARALGAELGSDELLVEAIAWRVPAFVDLCDLDSARTEAAELRKTAERAGQPFKLHVAAHYESALALCDGRLELAEAQAERAREWSSRLSGGEASGIYGIQLFGIRREQGRLAELASLVRAVSGAGQPAGPWRPGLIVVLTELGMEKEARRELDALLGEGLDPLRASLWLASLCYLTDACTMLGDSATAQVLYRELEPFAGGNVMIGHLVACYGAADRYLGMLAATAGEVGRAQQHFERALALNRRMRATTWIAHTAYHYARLLLAEPTERERAEALLDEAAALAEAAGLAALAAQTDAARRVSPGRTLPDDLSPREAQILRLVARGLSNREIGEHLFISEHTAANHVSNILRKTGCANRTEAASYAHVNRLAPN